jgi:hypothetical protein
MLLQCKLLHGSPCLFAYVDYSIKWGGWGEMLGEFTDLLIFVYRDTYIYIKFVHK